MIVLSGDTTIRDEMIRLYNSGDRSTWLLGDAGYSLEPWLMTPITNAPEGSAEVRYTECHTSTRNCVERMFGVLKSVWRCRLSHRVLHYSPIIAAKIIITCAVLHNMRFCHNLMNREIDIDEEGEAVALQRARVPDNLLARERIRVRAEEIAGADEAHFNHGERLTEARRIQRNILRTQFGFIRQEG